MFVAGGIDLNFLLLILIIIGISAQQITQKIYNRRSSGAYTFTALSALCAAMFFAALSIGSFSFDSGILIYSFLFALAYMTSIVGLFLAIATGPLSLSSLFSSYSLLIPTFYGIIFLKEKMDLLFGIGIAALLVSLVLTNKEDKGEKKITPIWILYVLLAFLGNGSCTVIQKIQQERFDGGYKNEFMLIALLLVFAVSMVLALVFERKDMKLNVKKGGIFCVLCGAFNGMVNLLVMVLTGRMSISVMFPVISAGGIIVTFIISRFIYKERLSKLQNVGFLLGVVAVIILNI